MSKWIKTFTHLGKPPAAKKGRVSKRLRNRRIGCYPLIEKEGMYYFQFTKLNGEDGRIDHQHIILSEEAVIEMISLLLAVKRGGHHEVLEM